LPRSLRPIGSSRSGHLPRRCHQRRSGSATTSCSPSSLRCALTRVFPAPDLAAGSVPSSATAPALVPQRASTSWRLTSHGEFCDPPARWPRIVPALTARRIVLDETPTAAVASVRVTHVEVSNAALRSSTRPWTAPPIGCSVDRVFSEGSGRELPFSRTTDDI